jgi:signal transduction histidine kinase
MVASSEPMGNLMPPMVMNDTTRIDRRLSRLVRWGGPDAYRWASAGGLLALLCWVAVAFELFTSTAMAIVMTPVMIAPLWLCLSLSVSRRHEQPVVARGWALVAASLALMGLGHAVGVLGQRTELGLVVALGCFVLAPWLRVLALLTLRQTPVNSRDVAILALDLILLLLLGGICLTQAFAWLGTAAPEPSFVAILMGLLPLTECAVLWVAWWTMGASTTAHRAAIRWLAGSAAVLAMANAAAFVDATHQRIPGPWASAGWVLGMILVCAAVAAQRQIRPSGMRLTTPSKSYGGSPVTATVLIGAVMVLLVAFAGNGNASAGEQALRIALLIVMLLRLLVVVEDRQRLTRRLRAARDLLEARVRDRTEAVEHTNEILRQEMNERRRAETNEREARSLADALLRSSQAVNSSLDLDEVLDRVLIIIRQTLPHAAASIVLVEGGTAKVLRRHGWEASDHFPRSVFQVEELPALARLLADGLPCIWGPEQGATNQVIQHESWMRAVVAVRLRAQDSELGAIVLASPVEGTFQKSHVDRLVAFAEQMSLAIGNARAYALVNRRAVRLAQLGELSASIARSQDLATVQRLATEGLSHTLAAERVRLVMMRDAAEGTGLRAVFEGAETQLANHGRTLAAPVRLDGETLAVLTAKSREDELFTSEDAEHATTIANLLAARMSQVRLLEAERAARITAEDASRLKSEFLANTTHELRTPLTGVLVALDLAREDWQDTDERQRVELITTAQESAQRLLETINSILDLSKIEAGRMEVHLESVVVAEIAAEVLRNLKARADQQGLYLRTSGAVTVRADPAMVRRILFNLVGNGLKFTITGGVTIELQEGVDQGMIRVSDTGIGIATPDQHRLFTPFTQVDGSFSRAYEGTGLGLAISRRMAEQMGGSLDLVSKGIGNGTTLTLRLPLA